MVLVFALFFFCNAIMPFLMGGWEEWQNVVHLLVPQINEELVKHKGLVFGGLDLKTGKVAWKKLVYYSGVLSPTDQNNVVLQVFKEIQFASPPKSSRRAILRHFRPASSPSI